MHSAIGQSEEESSEPSRTAVVIVALAGCGIATYLTLYQWHVLSSVWDPIWGSASSEAVLTSGLSRALPLPDATLGAIGYAVEAAAAIALGSRLRGVPSAHLAYGIIVAAMAAVSFLLVLTQVLVIRHLCFLCLLSAAMSFIAAGLARKDVLWALRWPLQSHLFKTSPRRQLKRGRSH
jgi:uncharacterized membrane protein